MLPASFGYHHRNGGHHPHRKSCGIRDTIVSSPEISVNSKFPLENLPGNKPTPASFSRLFRNVEIDPDRIWDHSCSLAKKVPGWTDDEIPPKPRACGVRVALFEDSSALLRSSSSVEIDERLEVCEEITKKLQRALTRRTALTIFDVLRQTLTRWQGNGPDTRIKQRNRRASRV